jgi:hypothetical protein
MFGVVLPVVREPPEEEGPVTSEVKSSPEATGEEDRRADPALRTQVTELLGVIREFHHTCHMVALGQLEASRAKAKARVLEEKIQDLVSEMLEGLEDPGEES